MSGMQKLMIQINGAKYPITTAEDPGYVTELAEEIDKTVKELVIGSSASVNEALVLISLSYLDSYKKSEKSADHLRSQIAEYLEDASKARLEASEARREVTRLQERLKNREPASR